MINLFRLSTGICRPYSTYLRKGNRIYPGNAAHISIHHNDDKIAPQGSLVDGNTLEACTTKLLDASSTIRVVHAVTKIFYMSSSKSHTSILTSI